MKSRANGELCKQVPALWRARLLQGGTSSSPGSGFPARISCSPPRMAGSSPPSSLGTLHCSCVFEIGLFITHTSPSQEIMLWLLLVKKLGLDLAILRLHLRPGPQRLGSIKTSNKSKAYGSFSNVHHFNPLAAAIASNLPQRYHLPKNHNPSTRLQTPRYLSQLVPEEEALIYFLDKDLEKNLRENISAL